MKLCGENKYCLLMITRLFMYQLVAQHCFMLGETVWNYGVYSLRLSYSQKDVSHSTMKTKQNKIKVPFCEEIGKNIY